MKTLIGLGNPGEKYKNNRHNAGFMLLEYIAENSGGNIEKKENSSKLHSLLTFITIKSNKYLFVEPQTFMNKSGEAVGAVLSFYKLGLPDITILYDDLDIRLGDYKMHLGGGPKLHNGILSIEQILGTRDFHHVRLGVDNRTPESPIDGETYVLQDFTPDEKIRLNEEVFPKVMQALSL